MDRSRSASQPVTVHPGHCQWPCQWAIGMGPDTPHHDDGIIESSSMALDSAASESQPARVTTLGPGRAMPGTRTDGAGYDALSARRIQVNTMMPAALAGHSVPCWPGPGRGCRRPITVPVGQTFSSGTSRALSRRCSTYSVRAGTYHLVLRYSIKPTRTCTLAHQAAPFEYALFTPSHQQIKLLL